MPSLRGQTRLTNIQPEIPSRITVFLIKEVSVSFNHRRSCESRSIPPHPQGGVQAGGGGKEYPNDTVRPQAFPSALPPRTSFPTSWFSLVCILHPMAVSLMSISIQLLHRKFVPNIRSSSGQAFGAPLALLFAVSQSHLPNAPSLPRSC